ncbi:MAG: hypothetical protein HRT35_09485 [Algicola sp.]|nr:hypothetical protein [Algicola sp.]
MALKEIRIGFDTGNDEKDFVLNGEIGQPFSWYMDTVMRGRFKQYSGAEVKGINIVNISLYHPDYIKKFPSIEAKNEWLTVLNTLNLEANLDLRLFKGDQQNQILKAINYFIEKAELSDLPQMKRLAVDTRQSIGKISIVDSIKKANDFYQACLDNRAAIP